jgi:hypothetical protein
MSGTRLQYFDPVGMCNKDYFFPNAQSSLVSNETTIKYNGEKYFEIGVHSKELIVPTQCFVEQQIAYTNNEYYINIKKSRRGQVLSTFSVFGYDIRHIKVMYEDTILLSKEYPVETHKVLDFDLGKYGLNLLNKKHDDYFIAITAGHFECVLLTYLYFDSPEQSILADLPCNIHFPKNAKIFSS